MVIPALALNIFALSSVLLFLPLPPFTPRFATYVCPCPLCCHDCPPKFMAMAITLSVDPG